MEWVARERRKKITQAVDTCACEKKRILPLQVGKLKLSSNGHKKRSRTLEFLLAKCKQGTLEKWL